MVIFSHRGIGFGKKENSLEALSHTLKQGFSIETDLRLKDNQIILSHNSYDGHQQPREFRGLLRLMDKYPDSLFALHFKEPSHQLYYMVAEAIKQRKNCFLFVTDFPQENFINIVFKLLGKDHLALYVTSKDINPMLAKKTDYLWLDETRENTYKDLDYFLNLDKKIVCCSPELFLKDYEERIGKFREEVSVKGKIYGICTDFPGIFSKNTAGCPVCEAQGPHTAVDRTGKYTILRCNTCEMEFSDPMRGEPGYYEYLHYANEPNLNNVLGLSEAEFMERAKKLSDDINYQPHHDVLKWIDKNIRKDSYILDVGCGIGWLMAALKLKGYKPIGTEVSSRVVEGLKKKGFQAYLGSLENLPQDIHRPSLVLLLGVIEHVDNPVQLLGCIRKKFPKAILLVSIPSPKRWDFNLGMRNYWDFPPNHLTPKWTEESLRIALTKVGFSLKEWIFTPIISDEIWFVFLDWFFMRLGLRKKGYFVGLTKEIEQGRNSMVRGLLKFSYPLLIKINTLMKYIARPFLGIFAAYLKKKGFTGLSAVAVAYPLED